MGKGFVQWQQGLICILAFLLVIGFVCSLLGYIGTKMINEIGNFPSKSAKVQFSAGWKLILIEIVAFGLLIMIFRLFL